MRALTWQGTVEGVGRDGAGPEDPGADRRDRTDDLHRDLRLRPAPVRRARHVHRQGRRARARADGHRRGGRRRGHPHPARRPGGDPVQHLLRALLDVQPRLLRPVRDHPGQVGRTRAPRCSATPSCTGRSPAARPSTCGCRRRSSARSRCRTVTPTSGTCSSPTCSPRPGRRRSTPTSSPGDTVAGHRPRPDRPDERPDRPPPRRGPGDRDRQRPRAAGDGPAPRHRGDRTSTRSTTCPAAIFDSTGGRGADGVIEAVGMEAHGTPFQAAAIKAAGLLPDPLARKATETFGVDRMAALRTAFARGPPGRHHLDHRRVRRRGRPVPDDGPLRQGRHDADGPGPREALGRRHHAAADRRRRPAGRGRPDHPPAAAGRGAARATRSSRRRRTAASRSSSSPARKPAARGSGRAARTLPGLP